MFSTLKLAPLVAVALVGGCVALPNGPSVMALPGTGKSFDQFRYDDAQCRQYAYEQVGGQTANQAATDAAVSSAVVGTLVGAAVGAAFNGSQGAGAGAATGLLFGSAAGASAARGSAYGSQRSYDNAYVQCMYARGEKVPISGRHVDVQPYPYPERAPVPTYLAPNPPPPPGAPPPPPPDAPR
jgi:hypothetical protein